MAEFAPLLYVVWADGDLSADELGAVCERVGEVLSADRGCAEELGAWLDPSAPPTAAELADLLDVAREFGAGPEASAESMLDRAAALAAGADGAAESAERKALAALADALGLVGRETAPRAPTATPESVVEVAALRAWLDGDRAPLRDELRTLLSSAEFERPVEIASADHRELVLSWCKNLADRGYGALGYPLVGGGKADLFGFIAAFETIALFDLSLVVKFGVQFGLFGLGITMLGTERHHRELLPDIGSLALPGCFAMTETGHGSDVAALETTATYDPATAEFVVHSPTPASEKNYIGNAAAHGHLAIVFAQLVVGGEGHGVHAVLVPIRDRGGGVVDGVTIEDCGRKVGLNGIDNGIIRFDRVRVPRTNLLDRFASVTADGQYDSPIASDGRRFFTQLGTLVGGRIAVGLAAVSATKSALAIAVRYATRRRQFGPKDGEEYRLLDYRSHRRRLLPRLARAYALHCGLRELAAEFTAHEGDDRREIEAAAAGLKALATWHATDTIQACREACGGQGYLSENRFADLRADTDVFATFEGDNTVLLQLLAKGLLSGYARQFHDIGVLGFARHLAKRAATAVNDLNPVTTRRTATEHLRDREFLAAVLEHREQDLIASLARRVKKRIDAGADGFDALASCQNHALAAARAHVERLLLDRFAAAAAVDSELAEPLDELVDLYALSAIEADAGYFLESGLLSASKAKAVRKQVDGLCEQVAPNAVALVDAFGISDALLGAPIAIGDGG